MDLSDDIRKLQVIANAMLFMIIVCALVVVFTVCIIVIDLTYWGDRNNNIGFVVLGVVIILAASAVAIRASSIWFRSRREIKELKAGVSQ